MEIDIYDFDKTIVPFDSGSLFWMYCLVHYPWTAVLLPLQLVTGALAFLHIISFTRFKKFIFSFVALIPLEKAVKRFWDRYESQVHGWFYDRKRYSVVISASPDFLLDEIGKRLGFDKLICSRHNARTGTIIGENCRAEEKVRRLGEELDMSSVRVVDVYSDSLAHDRPIFSLGEHCWHIVGGERIAFDYDEVYNNK
jgi:phosphoserine phosphatase